MISGDEEKNNEQNKEKKPQRVNYYTHVSKPGDYA